MRPSLRCRRSVVNTSDSSGPRREAHARPTPGDVDPVTLLRAGVAASTLRRRIRRATCEDARASRRVRQQLKGKVRESGLCAGPVASGLRHRDEASVAGSERRRSSVSLEWVRATGGPPGP